MRLRTTFSAVLLMYLLFILYYKACLIRYENSSWKNNIVCIIVRKETSLITSYVHTLLVQVRARLVAYEKRGAAVSNQLAAPFYVNISGEPCHIDADFIYFPKLQVNKCCFVEKCIS